MERTRGARRLRELSGRPAIAALMIASLAAPASAQAQAQAQAASIARPAPAGAPQPRAVTDLASALAQTAAVVEATVSELGAEYRDAEGPWTRVVLGDVKVHAGAAPKALELWQFGGALPNGRMMVAAELPVFVKGQRYLLLLRNTAWNVSPIVGGYALRVEQADGAEVLVTSDGQAVLGLDASGARLGGALFEPAPFDGSKAKAVSGGLAALRAQGAAPLDRAGFVAALQAELARQGGKLGGTFLERPAGRFQWRGQATTPHGQPNAAGGGTTLDTGATRDTSGGAR
jgi:hypothetical protein